MILPPRGVIECMKEVFKNNVYTIRVTRPNFDSGATQEQLNHASEVALDDYEFDTLVINSGTLDDFRLQAMHYADYVLNERR